MWIDDSGRDHYGGSTTMVEYGVYQWYSVAVEITDEQLQCAQYYNIVHTVSFMGSHRAYYICDHRSGRSLAVGCLGTGIPLKATWCLSAPPGGTLSEKDTHTALVWCARPPGVVLTTVALALTRSIKTLERVALAWLIVQGWYCRIFLYECEVDWIPTPARDSHSLYYDEYVIKWWWWGWDCP